MSQLEIWGRGIDTHRFQPKVERQAVWRKWSVRADAFIILYVGRLGIAFSNDYWTATWMPQPCISTAAL
ncbi:hypothetical protein ACIFQM_15285 [Paenibacillus sp. NRS-1782]|uniref:hypothetical protein n=1 Tax=unclassified Paenibacillus TaxID=185978 RepID=UPI003D28336A